MANAIETKVDGKNIIVTINTDEANFKASRSGKTDVISTGGNMPVSGTRFKLGLNLMKPSKEAKAK